MLRLFIDVFRSNAVYLFAEMNKLPAIICAVLLFLGLKTGIETKSILLIKLLGMYFWCLFIVKDKSQIRAFLVGKIVGNEKYMASASFLVLY